MNVSTSLLVHIAAGGIGLLGGAAALCLHKGARLHRVAGSLFVVAMGVMSLIGAWLAVSKLAGLSIVAGVFGFYLAATGWLAIRRREGRLGLFDYFAPLIALGAALAAFGFGWQAEHGPGGRFDGVSSGPYFGLAAAAEFAVMLDLRMLLRGGLAGVERLTRHLWRLCAALLVAVSAFFLGQAQLFPEPLRDSPLLSLPVYAVALALVYWLIRVRFGNHDSGDGTAPSLQGVARRRPVTAKTAVPIRPSSPAG